MRSAHTLLASLLATSMIAGCAHTSGAPAAPGTRSCHGVTLAERIRVDGTELTLNGLAVRDVTIFDVDVYVGALYLEQPSTDAESVVATEQRRRIVLRFIRGVSRTDIVTAWQSGFINNAGTERLGLTEEIERFVSFFGAVDDDAEMVFDYVPGVGLSYSLDGELRGTIEGAEFARAFLLVFVGPNPPSRTLKQGLLGGPCD